MGCTGVRAVALCKPEVIELLNQNFISVSLDNFLEQFDENVNKARRAADRWPSETVDQANRILASLKAAMRAQGGAVSTFVLTPDGQQVAIGMPMVSKPDKYLLKFLQQNVAGKPTEAGALPRYVSQCVEDPGPEGIQLRVVSRYPDDTTLATMERFNAGLRKYTQSSIAQHALYAPFFAGPTRDWIALREVQCKALAPPRTPRLVKPMKWTQPQRHRSSSISVRWYLPCFSILDRFEKPGSSRG